MPEDRFGRKSGQSSSRFAVPDPSKSDGYGPLGFIGNLGGDVRDATVGFLPGVVRAAKDPRQAFTEVAKSTWHDWSPLFQGDFAEFGRRLYAHPLAPLLDIASVATLGAGAAGKIASVGTRAEFGAAVKAGKSVNDVSKMAQFGRARDIIGKGPQGAPDVAVKHLSGNPMIRARQQSVMAVTTELADQMPRWFGRFSDAGRYERAIAKNRSYRQGAKQAAIHAQMQVWVKGGKEIVENPNRVATMIDGSARGQMIDHAYRVPEAKLISKRRVRATGPKQPGKEIWLPGGETLAIPGTKRTSTVTELRPDKGWLFLKKDAPREPTSLTGYADYEKWVKTMGARHTTRNPHNAMRAENGDFLLVPDHAVKIYAHEAVQSSKMMRALYSKPTKVWKWATLAARPAYFVNNAVGNTFMYMMASGPAGVRGLVDAYREIHGERATVRSLQGADRDVRKRLGNMNNPIDRWYLGVYKQGFAHEAAEALKIPGEGRMARAVNVGAQGLYPVTHEVAEVFLRRSLLHNKLRAAPEVRAHMSDGKTFHRAIDEVSQSDVFRSRITEQVNDVLGEYHHLNDFEKSVRQIVPFYTWDRAILRHGVSLGLNHPTRTVVGARIGQQQAQWIEEAYGKMPRFLKGIIPLGKASDGRLEALTTQGLNPYATLSDLTDTAGALFSGKVKPGEAIGLANPLLVAGIEAVTGQSVLTGARKQDRPGGLIYDFLANVAVATPLIAVGDRLAKGTPESSTGKPFLYRKDREQSLLGFLGIPLKGIDLARAAEMAEKEANVGRKKSKKKKQRTSRFDKS